MLVYRKHHDLDAYIVQSELRLGLQKRQLLSQRCLSLLLDALHKLFASRDIMNQPYDLASSPDLARGQFANSSQVSSLRT